MEIDPSKQYKTLNDYKVTIYTTTAKGSCPVHGCIHFSNYDKETAWTSEGKHLQNNYYNLVPIPSLSDLDPATQAIITFLKDSSIAKYHKVAVGYVIITTANLPTAQMGTSTVDQLLASISTICPDWREYID